MLPFPRQANSWYHWSKVHDSNNVMFACRIWGLSATDVMQGVVFGAESDEPASDPRLATRFDIDQAFGTAVNRFCAQTIIGHPLTLYGKGRQRRGFLPLRDSMQCLTLALDNPPARGEYRVFNQFAEVHDVTDIALRVQSAAGRLGLRVEPIHIENPRLEKEEHYYNPDHGNLRDLGYVPARSVDDEITAILKHLEPHRHRIERLRDVLLPDICWDGTQTEGRRDPDMIVVVTGGCGFIGSNLVPVLLEAGHAVRVLDDLSTGTREAIPGDALFIEGDVRNDTHVRRAVQGADAVIHLAGQSGVVPSQLDPRHDFELNAGGTLTMLLESRDAGISRFVFASSNAVAGEVEPPVHEGDARAAPVALRGEQARGGSVLRGVRGIVRAVGSRLAFRERVWAAIEPQGERGGPLHQGRDGAWRRDHLR